MNTDVLSIETEMTCSIGRRSALFHSGVGGCEWPWREEYYEICSLETLLLGKPWWGMSYMRGVLCAFYDSVIRS